MQLSFILAQARNGELAGLSKVDKSDEKVIGYLNMALIALYNRFQLATEEAIITLRPDLNKVIYTLDSTDSDVTVSGAPMKDNDFMSIIAAFEENGAEVTINDEQDPYSIFTTRYNKVQIPLLAQSGYVSIVYRKNPDLVAYVANADGDATDTSVALPIQLLEPALHYIGYRAHGAVDGNVNAENNTHYTRFINSCNQVEMLGIITADDTAHVPVQFKGYV